MNPSLAALAPMWVALVVVVALAVDVLIRLHRLGRQAAGAAQEAPGGAGQGPAAAGRPALSLVPSARLPSWPGDFDAMEAADEAAQDTRRRA